MADPEDKVLLATSYTCLRQVPAYANFIKERFERCLDLYLCPRVRRCALVGAWAGWLADAGGRVRSMRFVCSRCLSVLPFVRDPA